MPSVAYAACNTAKLLNLSLGCVLLSICFFCRRLLRLLLVLLFILLLFVLFILVCLLYFFFLYILYSLVLVYGCQHIWIYSITNLCANIFLCFWKFCRRCFQNSWIISGEKNLFAVPNNNKGPLEYSLSIVESQQKKNEDVKWMGMLFVCRNNEYSHTTQKILV